LLLVLINWQEFGVVFGVAEGEEGCLKVIECSIRNEECSEGKFVCHLLMFTLSFIHKADLSYLVLQ
jgi:hypothetical protein